METEFIRLCKEYKIPIPKEIKRNAKAHITDPPNILVLSECTGSSEQALIEAQHVFGHYICDFHITSPKNADVVADAIQNMLKTINNKVVFSPPSKNGER